MGMNEFLSGLLIHAVFETTSKQIVNNEIPTGIIRESNEICLKTASTSIKPNLSLDLKVSFSVVPRME